MNFSNLNGGGFQSKPRLCMCYICGREFGTASLKIHLKACAKKWEDQESLKPVKLRRPVPTPPIDFDKKITSTGLMDWDVIDDYNEIAEQKYNQEVLDKCKFCNRTFLPERMPGHKKICTKDKPMKPLPTKVAA